MLHHRSPLPSFVVAALACLLAVPAAATTVRLAGADHELAAHPRLLFDGPSGARVAALADPDGAGPKVSVRAAAANPPFAAVADLRACVAATPPCVRDTLAADTLLAALDWFMDRSQQASLRAARHWLDNIETLVTPGHGFGCSEGEPDCGIGAASDRVAADLVLVSLAYTLVRSEMAPVARADLARKLLNGVPGTAPCRNQRTAAGVAAWTADTCGLVWRLQRDADNLRGRSIGFAATSLAAAVAPEQTTLRVTSPAALPATPPYLLSLDGIEVVRIVAAAGADLEGERGVAGTRAGSFRSGVPVYAAHTLPATGTADAVRSGVVARLAAYAFVGNAFADDSPAAAALFAAAADDWLTQVQPKNRDMWTGFQQGGSGAFGSTQLGANAALTALLRQVGGAAADRSGGAWLRNAVPAYLMTTLPGDPTRFLPWGEPATAASPDFGGQLWAPLLVALYGPESIEAQHWNHWQREVAQRWTPEVFARPENRAHAALALAFADADDPRRDYTAELPLQRAFRAVDGNPSRALAAWVSREGWRDAADTLVFQSLFAGGWGRDHAGAGAPGAYRIYAGGWLLGENGPNDTGAGVDTNMPLFGGTADLTPSRLLSVQRELDDDPHGAVAYLQLNSQAAYHARASAARALRSLVHFKKPGTRDYVVVYDSLQSVEPRAKTIHLHYDVSPEEESAMTSAQLPTLVWTGPDRRLSTTVVLPRPPQVAATYSREAHAHRVALCASVDGTTCAVDNIDAAFLVVHRPATAVDDTMPPVRLIEKVDPGFVAVQIEGRDAKVAVFPAAGVSRPGVTLETSHAGVAQLLVTGLQAGTYDVRVDGGGGCEGIVVKPSAEALACEVGAGVVRVTRR